jgi:hypothetical protein
MGSTDILVNAIVAARGSERLYSKSRANEVCRWWR